jgi:hypothetical protein
VVVPVASVHRGVLDALSYARSLNPDRLVAVSIVTDEADVQRIRAQWQQYELTIELRTLHSPYRELTGPVLDFLDEVNREQPDHIVTVILPEFVLDRWWEHLLHNQSALVLKARLLFRPDTVVISVPFHLGQQRPEEPDEVPIVPPSAAELTASRGDAP